MTEVIEMPGEDSEFNQQVISVVLAEGVHNSDDTVTETSANLGQLLAAVAEEGADKREAPLAEETFELTIGSGVIVAEIIKCIHRSNNISGLRGEEFIPMNGTSLKRPGNNRSFEKTSMLKIEGLVNYVVIKAANGSGYATNLVATDNKNDVTIHEVLIDNKVVGKLVKYFKARH